MALAWALGIWAFFSSPAWAGPLPAPVVIDGVRQASISDPVETIGTLRSYESIVLTAQVSGIIRAIHFRDGQRVESGALLVELDDREERALLEEAEVRLIEAERQYQRIASLAAQRAATDAQRDEYRRNLDMARAAVSVLKVRLDQRVIRAPFAGVLGLRSLSPGAFVTPGTPIATLDDDHLMRLEFSVPSIHLAALRPGLAVEAETAAFGDERFIGTLEAIDSRIDPASRTIRVHAILPNPGFRLRPGLLMQVRLSLNPREALLVPETAVFYREGRPRVVRVVEGEGGLIGEPRAVRLGRRVAGAIEVLDGLAPGDRVVIAGQEQVRPGQPLRPVDPPVGLKGDPDCHQGDLGCAPSLAREGRR